MKTPFMEKLARFQKKLGWTFRLRYRIGPVIVGVLFDIWSWTFEQYRTDADSKYQIDPSLVLIMAVNPFQILIYLIRLIAINRNKSSSKIKKRMRFNRLTAQSCHFLCYFSRPVLSHAQGHPLGCWEWDHWGSDGLEIPFLWVQGLQTSDQGILQKRC